jgi:hypothetical protein
MGLHPRNDVDKLISKEASEIISDRSGRLISDKGWSKGVAGDSLR